jgi:hypothetical protein
MTGLVNELLVDNKEPVRSHTNLYFHPKLASKVTVPEPHTDDGVVELTFGDSFTVAITAVRVWLVQPFDMAST